MNRELHPRAFLFTVAWTLLLLLLGSVVHATESSLACPDWPTCFGSMVPEMTGGVFWEHLHRLVAGGLILFFLLATYLAWREGPRFGWVRSWAVIGIALLLIQAVLGGITVIYKLPDAISISHLGLAFLFLALSTVLFTTTSRSWDKGIGPVEESRGLLRSTATGAALLTFIQSLVGAAVRHTDAGMACPDVPLCFGQVVPALDHGLVALHFGHRALGIVLFGMVLLVGHLAFWKGGNPRMRVMGASLALVVTAQLLLGFYSVFFRLAVVPVSLHTLLAAILLTLCVSLATLSWAGGPSRG